ncbi:MAG: LysM peptidoglycan-binding domain-containing protein [Treponema sp.]|nr:LysM peptidoglycan-binding domain-containing protein [Treponema sp.]
MRPRRKPVPDAGGKPAVTGGVLLRKTPVLFLALFLLRAADLRAEQSQDMPPENPLSSAVVPQAIGNSRPLRNIAGRPAERDRHAEPTRFAFHRPPPSEPLPGAASLLSPKNVENPATKQFIQRFSLPAGIVWLNGAIRNGHTYIPFVREEIRLRDLPPELVVVPIIESDYIGTARSRSGAVGLWQFMLNSIEPFGIRVTDLLDERRDFRKATVSALRKLREHRQVFGDWTLALAAYNMGPNGLRRAMERAGTNDYWRLAELRALSTETAGFVPRIVAVSYLLANARQYGIDWWPEGVDWTALPCDRQVSLDFVASKTGADPDLLRRLNLELLHGVSPAGGRELVVPSSHAARIAALLEEGDIPLIFFHRYQVRPGDTLWSLSRHYGVTVEAIQQGNRGLAGRYLIPGEVLNIPAYREVAEPERTEPPASGKSFSGTHTVVHGDTMWALSRRYGVDVAELAGANGLELGQILSIGMVLRVPIMEE